MRKLSIMLLFAIILTGCGDGASNENILPVCIYEPAWNDFDTLGLEFDTVDGETSEKFTEDELMYCESQSIKFERLYEKHNGSINYYDFRNITPPGFFRNTGYSLFYLNDRGEKGAAYLMYESNIYEIHLWDEDALERGEDEVIRLFPLSCAAADTDENGEYELYFIMGDKSTPPQHGTAVYAFDPVKKVFGEVEYEFEKRTDGYADPGYIFDFEYIKFKAAQPGRLELACESRSHKKWLDYTGRFTWYGGGALLSFGIVEAAETTDAQMAGTVDTSKK